MTDGKVRRILRTYRSLAWAARQAAAFEAAIALARSPSLPPPTVGRSRPRARSDCSGEGEDDASPASARKEQSGQRSVIRRPPVGRAQPARHASARSARGSRRRPPAERGPW